VDAVLIDASGLIALLDRGDRNHQACVHALAALKKTDLVTVYPALTEAMHMLGDTPPGQEAIFDMLEDNVLGVAPLEAADLRRMKALMRKYRDRPMDFADAALVRVAERDRLYRILTFDRDFKVYSLPGRQRFVLVADQSR